MRSNLRALVAALLLAPQAALALGLGDVRLASALNEPLTAEIDLIAATPEELSSLQARLASREMFERYGLDRPGYLDSVQFRVGKGRDGRNVLLVRSTQPVLEPFVSFLVEVSWGQGRLLREYTLLLDPPVYAPSSKSAPAPVAAPRTSTPVPAPAPRPAAPVESAPATAPAPAAAPGASANPGEVVVQRNDTLYGIASTLTSADRPSINRMMVGLYQANPGAFGGNINRLRSGAVLRVPGEGELAGISAQEAAREIARQNQEWRGSTAAAADEAARLKLVTPTEGAAAGAATSGTGAGAGAGAAESARVEALQRELAEQKRLLELKNAELAELQQRVGEPVTPPAAADEAPLDESPIGPEDEAAVTPPVAEEAPKPAKKPRVKEAPVEAPSFFDTLTGNWLYLLGAAGVLIAGGLGFGYLRRRREEAEGGDDDVFRVPPPPARDEDAARTRSAAVAAAGAAAAATARPAGMVVEERKGFGESLPVTRPGASSRLDETISADVALNIDQSDPLAEADFHMAYGLYDQAADLVKIALQREPDRRDLKLKLVEIFFVWGNKDQFLATARDLGASRGQLAPGEWERVAIMGRQIAADDPLFAGSAPASASVDSDLIDLNLEGGENRVDLDVFGAPAGDSIDLDLGGAIATSDRNAETGENSAIDFSLDSGFGNELPTVETPALGSGTTELPTIESPLPDLPTIETPVLGDTVNQRRGSDTRQSPMLDATAELNVDDLGLDLSDLESLGNDDATRLAPSMRDDATRVAPRDDAATWLTDATGILDGSQLAQSLDAGGTAMLPELDAEADSTIDFNLGGTMSKLPKMDGDGPLDLDLGGFSEDLDRSQTATERMSLDELPQMTDLEPVTLSEVGTKLDLARAYMDMGDPDGARAILQEVMNEGSASQKQEAQRLLGALPGGA